MTSDKSTCAWLLAVLLALPAASEARESEALGTSSDPLTVAPSRPARAAPGDACRQG